jgi:DASS family divalent anion:Na+ symporter
LALAALLLIYFYAHYVFASITAHATAMFVPFLIVIMAAGTPTYLAVLSLAYFSNLGASLTHYGTTPAPIYFGAGYTTQRTWWTIGLITSVVTIVIWSGRYSDSGKHNGWLLFNPTAEETRNQGRIAYRVDQRA